jgi:hypothetical protein
MNSLRTKSGEWNVENKVSVERIAASLAAAITAIIGFTQDVAAQGCAACYESAAASGAQGRAALRHGILILLIPTLSLIGVIVGLVYNRRNACR